LIIFKEHQSKLGIIENSYVFVSYAHKICFYLIKILYNSNVVECYCIFIRTNIYIFIPEMVKLDFQHQSSVSHGPSEIILIWGFGAQLSSVIIFNNGSYY